MINSELLKILSCPQCTSDIEIESENTGLICSNKRCRLKFSVIDDIPVMLPQNLKEDLVISQQKWDQEYRQHHDLEKIDLSGDLELIDALAHINKFKKNREGFFLEAGCGPSKVSCLLAKEGIRTVGIDFSLNALRLSKALFQREGVKGHFVYGDILNMPFKDNVFSFVYTGGVIEHFRDTQKAVNEIYRCLVMNGLTTNTVPYISLSTPYRILRWGNIPDIPLIKESIEFIETNLFRKKFMRFGYEKSFTQRKMKKLFSNAGFKNVKINLFKTYYPLEWIKFKPLKKMLTTVANSRLFWPMIYILAEKS